jgi:cysteine-rich repeat protein
MRTLLLASLALIPACLIGTGNISGDDQKTPGVCGDGIVNSGETCDDGNTASGDGCSSTCQTESASTPRVDAALDKTTISTELNKTETAQLTLTSQNGFSGTVNITAALTDTATSAAIPGVTVMVAATADLAPGGTTMVPLTIKIPSDATGAAITANLKVDLSSTAAPVTASASVAIDHYFTVLYPDGAGTVVANHQFVAGNFTVLRGTIIRFKNEDTTVLQHITHGDGNTFPHQEPIAASTALVGTTYEVPTIGISPGSIGQLGCHDHESGSTYITFTVM